MKIAFTADHHGFYRNEASFYPLIQDRAEPLMNGSNAVVIRLPAHLSDDLNWTGEMQLGSQVASEGKYILWEIDLGLNSFQFTPEDSASFYSFSLALEEFSKKVWPEFQENTFGVSLYRGAFSPRVSFPVASWERAFAEWFGSDYELFSVQLLSEYLHRLISFLPETVLPFAFIDVTEIRSQSKISQLFSKERFEYLHLALKGAQVPFSGICWEKGFSAQGWLGCAVNAAKTLPEISVGIYLPKDEHIDAILLEQLDRLILELQKKEMPFRIVCEEKLTEQWDGLDQLIVFSSALSIQGKRKLMGFIAAGGTISTVGEPIGLPEEEIIAF